MTEVIYQALVALVMFFFLVGGIIAFGITLLCWPSWCMSWQMKREEKERERIKALAFKIPHPTECRIWFGYKCNCAEIFRKYADDRQHLPV